MLTIGEYNGIVTLLQTPPRHYRTSVVSVRASLEFLMSPDFLLIPRGNMKRVIKKEVEESSLVILCFCASTCPHLLINSYIIL